LQISDEQLIEMFCSGDQKAFSQLIKRYEKELYNFLAKFIGSASLAEDVFQEVFLQVHLSADKFQTDRRFRPWLYTIASNKARDALRRRARRPALQLTANEQSSEMDLWNHLFYEETTPQDLLEQKQTKQQVRKTVEELPDHLREILILAYFNQHSYKEMAEVLNIPLGTVKSRLHAAVVAFSRLYKEQFQEKERN